MNPTRISSWIIASLLLAGSAFAAPTTRPQVPRDLLALGGPDRFWIAQVLTDRDDQGQFDVTHLLYRLQMGAWTELQPVSNRVVDLACDSGELLLVLDNGQWMIADEDSTRLGSNPPGNAAVLAMANDLDTLWAIVRTQPAATGASTEATTQDVIPSMTATEQHLLIYCIVDGKWINPLPLPSQMIGFPQQISLAVVERWPVVAWEEDDGRILISQLGADQKWSDPIALAVGPVENFKLLDIQNHPALWVASGSNADTQPGQLADCGRIFSGDNFSKSVVLKLSGQAPPDSTPQTVAVAFEKLRWLAVNPNGEPLEEPFDMETFQPTETVQPVANIGPEEVPLVPALLSAVLVMMVATFAGTSFRRGRPTEELPVAQPVKLRLAPLGVRMAAGLIDLLPLLATIGLLPKPSNDPAADNRTAMILFGIGILTYVGHTLIAELLCGQSIGKMMLGLRVVGTEGQVPKPTAIILRNLMRIVDVIPLLPLLFLPFTPLRQRIGDIAAGTVVVAREPESNGDE